MGCSYHLIMQMPLKLYNTKKKKKKRLPLSKFLWILIANCCWAALVFLWIWIYTFFACKLVFGLEYTKPFFSTSHVNSTQIAHIWNTFFFYLIRSHENNTAYIFSWIVLSVKCSVSAFCDSACGCVLGVFAQLLERMPFPLSGEAARSLPVI